MRGSLGPIAGRDRPSGPASHGAPTRPASLFPAVAHPPRPRGQQCPNTSNGVPWRVIPVWECVERWWPDCPWPSGRRVALGGVRYRTAQNSSLAQAWESPEERRGQGQRVERGSPPHVATQTWKGCPVQQDWDRLRQRLETAARVDFQLRHSTDSQAPSRPRLVITLQGLTTAHWSSTQTLMNPCQRQAAPNQLCTLPEHNYEGP